MRVGRLDRQTQHGSERGRHQRGIVKRSKIDKVDAPAKASIRSCAKATATVVLPTPPAPTYCDKSVSKQLSGKGQNVI